jgi:hypothetical protein
MGLGNVSLRLRVGWWAGAELSDPLAALTGTLLRAEMAARCPGLSPVLVCGTPVSWLEPGFTGEPVALNPVWAGSQPAPADLFVASGSPVPGGAKVILALAERGLLPVAVAPEEAWGQEPRVSVGPPFAVPEPALLAARHLPRYLLEARGAYLRVVEGLPERYVLVEEALLQEEAGQAGPDLDLALRRLAEAAGGSRPAELVRLAPGPLSSDDGALGDVLRQRRAEAEESRYQPEDWPGDADRPQLPLRVTSPLDLAAAVAGASAVVARSGALMALAWALGAPHVALGEEGSAASNFAAWTGDSSALAEGPGELVATLDNIFARRGQPPGLKRLEATLDQSLDEAASNLGKAAAAVPASGAPGGAGQVSREERLHELEAANEALRLRLAMERLRFAERAALLEKTAQTTVESAIKAVHGQDVALRRRLEDTEREMKRLQEETALQQAELREIHDSLTMKVLAPAREWYGRRLRRTAD